jgi:hypothetical protein
MIVFRIVARDSNRRPFFQVEMTLKETTQRQLVFISSKEQSP